MKRLILTLVFAGTTFAQTPVRVDTDEASLHTIPSPAFIRVPNPGAFDQVEFELRVNPLGQVVDARPLSGRKEYFEAAEAVARSRRYEPFLRDGQPVEAIVEGWIVVLPPEIEAKVRVPFPEVQDWKTVRIKLVRTVCFGSCPAYEVEIQGNGSVTYTGVSDIAVKGVHKGSIDRPSLESLISRFREADFFSFDARYASNYSDFPTYTTSLTIDGQAHTVADYDGARAGMPLVIGALERAIDESSGSAKWVHGNRETIPALRSEGFDFKSREAGMALAYIAREGDADTVRALILAGAPLDVPRSRLMGLIELPLRAAVDNPDPEVMRLLIEAGASKDDARTIAEAIGLAQSIGRQDVLEMLRAYQARAK